MIDARFPRLCDNYNLKSHKYVCITTCQPDAKSHPNPSPNPTTKQHALMNIQLNIGLHISRRIHTRQCCCTVGTTLGCICQSHYRPPMYSSVSKGAATVVRNWGGAALSLHLSFSSALCYLQSPNSEEERSA